MADVDLTKSNEEVDQNTFSTGRIAGAWLFPLAFALIANLVYMALSWFPNHRYLEWAEERPLCQDHLPDLFLDLHDNGEDEATVITSIADGIPGLGLLTVCGICLITRNLRLWNRFLMTQGSVILLNLIAEQVTTLPSSYGYKRCKAYLGINGPEDDSFSFSLTGSCTAMIWSGHVFHMMISGYMIGLALEQRFPQLRQSLGNRNGPLLKAYLVIILGLIEMIMLVYDKGHYTVDMYLAILISMLVFSNAKITYWVHRCNPFLGIGPNALCDHPVHPRTLKKGYKRLEAEIEALRANEKRLKAEIEALELAAAKASISARAEIEALRTNEKRLLAI